MGTNYYIRPKGTCKTRCDCWLHLGKSSIGWRFTFKAYTGIQIDPPQINWNVNDFESWLKLLDLGKIYDEYSQRVKRTELLILIDCKRNGKYLNSLDGFLDANGNYFLNGEFS